MNSVFNMYRPCRLFHKSFFTLTNIQIRKFSRLKIVSCNVIIVSLHSTLFLVKKNEKKIQKCSHNKRETRHCLMKARLTFPSSNANENIFSRAIGTMCHRTLMHKLLLFVARPRKKRTFQEQRKIVFS